MIPEITHPCPVVENRELCISLRMERYNRRIPPVDNPCGNCKPGRERMREESEASISVKKEEKAGLFCIKHNTPIPKGRKTCPICYEDSKHLCPVCELVKISPKSKSCNSCSKDMKQPNRSKEVMAILKTRSDLWDLLILPGIKEGKYRGMTIKALAIETGIPMEDLAKKVEGFRLQPYLERRGECPEQAPQSPQRSQRRNPPPPPKGGILPLPPQKKEEGKAPLPEEEILPLPPQSNGIVIGAEAKEDPMKSPLCSKIGG